MASSLKITRLDSPLEGLRRRDRDASPDAAPLEADSTAPADAESSPGVVARSVRATAPKPRRSRSRPARANATAAAAPAPTWRPGEGFWQPPALDERVELVSTRLPLSLARALERHTRALRDRYDGASQKALPMQEVLAAMLWAVGDPGDEVTVERVDAIYRAYRARRMAAAARALEPLAAES